MMKLPQKRMATFCDILAALVQECRLMITPDGLNVVAVDTANVAMVSVVLPKGQFAQFDDEKKAEVGMDLPKWKNVPTIMKDPESAIRIERHDGGRLTFTDGRYTYNLTPLDLNTIRKRPNPPTITLPASVVIDAKEFLETIKALAAIGDKTRFRITGDVLELSVEGDTDTLRKPLQSQEPKGGNPEVSSLFSLDYLKDIARAMKDAGRITVSAGQDHPVRFDFELDGMEVSYLLAPRIEGD